ncbi:MAG: sugar phosphate isomerase/epimerase [Planctomycetaceae bacterium]|nr:sugar phosphate isomerase/epimerase [Planctomycetaceae bacterium]
MDRRTFFSGTVALAAGALLARPSTVWSQNRLPVRRQGRNENQHSVRIGGPVFFSDADPEQWAAEAKKKYRAVYAPNVSLDDKDRIKAVLEAVQKHDLVIAEVGAWSNMLDSDAAKREKTLQHVIRCTVLADELNAKCCVNIAGSFSAQYWDGPDRRDLTREHFDATVENVRKILDAAKPKRTKFSLEMMQWALPDSADSYLKLIRAINRKGVGVHVDVCNLINSPEKMWNSTGVINEVFDKLSPWITSCHAKDVKWIKASSVQFAECPLGEGNIDYATYLKRVATHPDKDLPLMVEHMPDEATYDRCREHLLKIASENGISL